MVDDTESFVEKRHMDIGPPGDGFERRVPRVRPEPKTFLEKAESGLGRVIAVAASLFVIGGAFVTAGVLNNPFETKANAQEVYAATSAKVDDHEKRIQRLEGTLSDVLLTGKESQELQLIERIEKLQARAEEKPRGSQEAIEARRDIAEAQQKLAKVRREMGR